MKKTLALLVSILLSISLPAQETNKTKKNKVNLGNVKISAQPTEYLFQIGNKFVVYGDGNVGVGNGGSLLILGSNSGYVGLTAASEAGSTTYTLPSSDGKSGELLMTNGSGVLSWTPHPYRSNCPIGFILIGTPNSAEAFCISANQEPSTTWIKAITNCYNKSPKSRLCSANEWAISCVADGGPRNMTGHWEWLADSGSNYGRIIGLAGCDSFNGAAVDAAYASRCCFH